MKQGTGRSHFVQVVTNCSYSYLQFVLRCGSPKTGSHVEQDDLLYDSSFNTHALATATSGQLFGCVVLHVKSLHDVS